MVSDEFWWFLMDYYELWWVMITSGGLWCFMMSFVSWDLFQSDAIVLGLPTTHVYSVTVNLRTSPPSIQTFLKSDEIINYKLEVWWETNDPWIMLWFRSWAPPGTNNQCNKVQLPRKIVLEFETTKLVFEKWAPTFASHVPDLANQYCALVLEFTIVKTKFVKINQPIFQEINWPFECFVFYDPSCHIFCIRQTQWLQKRNYQMIINNYTKVIM